MSPILGEGGGADPIRMGVINQIGKNILHAKYIQWS